VKRRRRGATVDRGRRFGKLTKAATLTQLAQRIDEYEEAAVSRPDPFAAVIGMGAAFCQRIFEHVGTAVLEELDSQPHSVEEIREYEPVFNLLIKFRKSVEADLAFQAHYAGQQSAAIPKRKKGNRLETKAATGKRDLLPKRWMANG
jgi:hypothetical protein